jgi:hypothetical protein
MIIQANPGFQIAFAQEDGEGWFVILCDIVAWKIEDGKDPEPIAINAQAWIDSDTTKRTIVAPDGTTDFGGTEDVATWFECQKRMIAKQREFNASQAASPGRE